MEFCMKKVLLLLFLIFLSLSAFASNRVDCDLVVVAPANSVEGWTFINNNKLEVSKEPLFKDKLKWTPIFDGTKNDAVGIVKENLSLPMPEYVKFKVFPSEIFSHVAAFIVGFEDMKGNVGLYYAKDLKKMQWNDVNIKISDLYPFAIGAPKIEDISKISVFIPELGITGEHPIYFDDIEYTYPLGTYYKHGSSSEIYQRISDLRVKCDDLTLKHKALADKGFPCRYQLSAIRIIDQFIEETKKEADKNWLVRAEKKLDYLENLAEKTYKELNDIEANPQERIDYVESDLSKMKVVDGVLYAPKEIKGETVDYPVFLNGMVGWVYDPHYLFQKDYGYNCAAFEWPMVNTDNIDERNYFVNKSHFLRDNNMAFQVLFSPHYISGEQYEQMKDLDPYGFRKGQYISMYNVSSDSIKKLVKHHVENIVPLLKDNPLCLGYDLENELYSYPFPDFTYEKYQKDNQTYSNPWEREVKYNQFNMMEFVRFFRDEIEKIDNSKVIFTKCCPGLEVQGYKREDISEELSAHSFWSYSLPKDTTGDFAADFFLEGMELDSYNSFDKNKIITEGELHLNMVEADGADCTEEFVKWTMWNCFVRGKDASYVWGWGTDVEDYANMFHCQPWGMHALGVANMDVNRVAEYVVPFAKAPRDFAIFYGGGDITELYKAVTFSDANFDFITDKTVKKDLPKYKFVGILDNATVDPETLKIIKSKGIPIVTLKSEQDMRKYWSDIAAAKKKYSVTPLVAPGKFGLDCRSYKQGKETVFYLSNYNKEDVTVVLPAKSTDLLTGETYTKITLKPLDFYLMKF